MPGELDDGENNTARASSFDFGDTHGNATMGSSPDVEWQRDMFGITSSSNPGVGANSRDSSSSRRVRGSHVNGYPDPSSLMSDAAQTAIFTARYQAYIASDGRDLSGAIDTEGRTRNLTATTCAGSKRNRHEMATEQGNRCDDGSASEDSSDGERESKRTDRFGQNISGKVEKVWSKEMVRTHAI